MQGTVTKFSQTKNGKPTVYIDSKMYFVGRCDVSDLQVGDYITFEGHAFSDDGKLWGLDKWAKQPKPNGVTPHVTTPPITAGGSRDEPLTKKDESIFVCGVVNHAIAAGRIQDPLEIELWVISARRAFKGESV